MFVIVLFIIIILSLLKRLTTRNHTTDTTHKMVVFIKQSINKIAVNSLGS